MGETSFGTNESARPECYHGLIENQRETTTALYFAVINFMKYEKPPVSLDHLKHSEVYKLVHDMDQTPLKRVEMRTPVICEADYREIATMFLSAIGYKTSRYDQMELSSGKPTLWLFHAGFL
ncbi:unnamed protein product [Spodoptera exigua]|nr:unnamed protein product [Spodoptera exigua]